MGTSATSHADVIEIDDARAGFDVFDTVCQRELQIGGEEFLRRWDAGEYRHIDVDDVEGLPEVIAAMSFAR